MSTTRTGSFSIGFRRNGSGWQKDLTTLIAFAKEQQFLALDLVEPSVEQIRQVLDADLRIGSVDLKQPWSDLVSPDSAQRQAAAQAQAQDIQAAVAAGAHHFFAVVIPHDPALPRKQNFDFAVDGLGQLCESIASLDVKIVLEGWPGGPPYFSSLACTPADCSALFEAVGSDVLGINYDPSHLVRMGIDPLRFLDQFIDRVGHVHAKDTELLDEQLYQHGNLQQATLAEPHVYGGHHWRYTLPGRGCIEWEAIMQKLTSAGYQGVVCIELEDRDFHGSEAAEKRGLLASRDFLVHV